MGAMITEHVTLVIGYKFTFCYWLIETIPKHIVVFMMWLFLLVL